jgi:1-phosphofructokinase
MAHWLPVLFRVESGTNAYVSVMVFAPAPLLTVTIEQQAQEIQLHLHPGGQGVWQARMIAALGAPVTLCGSVGGETGIVLQRLMQDDAGVTVRAVHRDEETGWYVHDRRRGERTDFAEDAGGPLIRHDLDELYTMALTEGLRADVALLSGPADPSVIDADVYRRLAADLTANDVPVVADLSGDYVGAVLAGRVTFLKVSHEDLLADGRAASESVDALVAAGRQLRADGAESVLISRAGEPAVALFDDQEALVEVPKLEVADHRGAGDSMTAGVSAVLARGGDVAEAIRTGAAAGALNVTRHGLGTGHAEAVNELLGRVRLTTLP